MPPVIEAHFFAPNDLNGDTIFECSSDDAFFKGVKLDIQRDKLGSGQVTFARKVPTGLFTNDILKPEVFVRFLIPEVHATKYLWGMNLDVRQQKVVSTDEKGGKGFTFGGPGPKFYLTRQVVWSASFLGYDNAYDREAGLVTWPDTARSGAILNRLILEDAANPSGPFLPDLTKSFSDANDSNGDPWADDISGSEDFTLNMQDDYLKVLWQLENAAGIVTQIDLGEVGDPLMQLDAYQSFGRDLTGDIGSGVVHFTEGINIADSLDVEGESLRKASHALVKGADGVYELAVHPSGIGYKKVMPVDYSSSSNNTVLDQAGRRALARQVDHEFAPVFTIVPGFNDVPGSDDHGYFPGPDGTDGLFWVGDACWISTGLSSPTELDYNDTDITITGIELELLEAAKSDTPKEVARSFKVKVRANESRTSDSTHPQGDHQHVGGANCSCIRLARPSDPGTSSFTRLYYSEDAASFSPTQDANWDANDASTVQTMKLTPDGTFPSSHQAVNTVSGDASGKDICMGRFLYGPISADLAALIAAGGLTFRGQRLTYMRSGGGISEVGQHGVSQYSVRVTTGATTTIRGTALALHNLSLGSGAKEWEAISNDNVKKNRSDPPIGATNTLSAVAGTSAGDYLLFEPGVRNYSTVVTGSKHNLMNNSASDLPEDEVTSTVLNAWVEIADIGSGSTPGDMPNDTVRQGEGDPGISAKAMRSDALIQHGLLSADGLHYHNREDIEGSVDLALDELSDVDTTGVADGDVIAWDDAEGLWLPVTPSSGSGITGIDVKEGGSSAATDIQILDFGTGFDITESPSGEANVALDLTEVTVPVTDHNHTTAGGDGGDLDSPVIDGYAVFNEESAPSTPSSGTAVLYVKSDGRFYSKGDDGVERGPFDVAGSGGGSVVVIPGAPSGFPYIAAGATTELTTNQTSHTINLPAGIVAGSLLVMMVCVDGGTTISATGWTSITSGTSGTDVSGAALYRFADGSEGATVSITSSASEKVQAYVARIEGHHASTPPEGAGTGNASASVNSNPPTLTPSWGAANNLWFSIGIHDSSNPGAGFVHVGIPMLWTYLWHHAAAAADDGTVSIGFRFLNAASLDPLSYVAASGEQWAAMTIAVRPA